MDKDNQFSDINNAALDQTQTLASESQYGQIRFPIHALPERLQQVILAANKALKHPKDYLAAAMLSAASVAIGNTHHVAAQWLERPMLWIVIVGNPGVNKSHALSWVFNILEKREAKRYAKYKEEIERYQSDLKDYNRRLKKDELYDGEAEPTKPVFVKEIVRDYTPEALCRILTNSPKGVLLYSDELLAWLNNMNRYNSGSEVEMWLSTYSGKTISIDRKHDEPVYITNPFVSIVGTIQTDRLIELSKDGKDVSGFLDRFLFAFPDGLKKEYWGAEPLNNGVREEWENIITALLDLEYIDDAPKEITFTEEAYNCLTAWQRANTDECNDSAITNGSLASMLSKFDIHILRICLVLHFLRWSSNETKVFNIEAETVLNAVEIVKYFKATGAKVKEYINKPNLYKEREAQLLQELPATFKTADGKAIAEKIGVPGRTFDRLLTDTSIFKKLEHGLYEKVSN